MEHSLNLTMHWAGFTALAIFVTSYAFVMAEEFTEVYEPHRRVDNEER